MICNRRVVTGHDAEGRSCVIFDSKISDLPVANPKVAVAWATGAIPANNEGVVETCEAVPSIEMFNADGAKFLVMEMEPGDEYPLHQTDTIDFAVILQGQIQLTLETGSLVLGPGDLIVDRGALHSWHAVGDGTALMVATIIPARPLAA